jgi:hypothetical protein
MRRRHLRIRRWLVLAVAVMALTIAASASAMPAGDGGGGNAVSAQPVAVGHDTKGGFDWTLAAGSAAAVLGIGLAAAGVVHAGRTRRHPAGATH